MRTRRNSSFVTAPDLSSSTVRKAFLSSPHRILTWVRVRVWVRVRARVRVSEGEGEGEGVGVGEGEGEGER